MLGPIDYIIVGFEGNKFNGGILSALDDAIASGTIAVIALTLISKDEAGAVSIFDMSSAGDDVAAFFQKHQLSSDLITQDDVDEMAELLENNTAAGLLVIEQLWAKPLKQALLDANGVLVAEGRIHPDAVAELSEGKE